MNELPIKGRSLWRRGPLPLAYWDCWFHSRRGHECLSLVSVVWYQVSASGWSLVQRSPTECGVSWVWTWICDIEGALARQGVFAPCGRGGDTCTVQIVRLSQFTPLSVRIFVFKSPHSVRSMFAHRTSDYIIISSSIFVILPDTIRGYQIFCRRYSLWPCGPEWD
jgi:hypothetical protein